ncbi:flagellar hook-basal body complex protein FliE [Sodalis sp. dw_96]|uniref:flagellar hook-basal body complex protein FliE n=1 Tax=Sodalis sp. dw_96 TaxID=2719794 RepID=UPI001BD2832C|nr:flagellar hook-basal body complex protein FliE [Sodalis sp. dw_96]
MAISGIESAVQQLQHAAQAAKGVADISPVTGGSFADQLSAALDNLSDTQNKATQESQSYSTGASPLGLNDVMVDMQKSSIALQTGVQVRNKVVSAYNTIMNMTV